MFENLTLKKLFALSCLLFCLLCFNDKTQAQSDMIISGIIDGPMTGGTPKAIEFYVICDIEDLSIYGFGSANNGGGTDGEEFTFPAVAANAGDYIYVSSESTQFNSYFGFNPDHISSAANNNGDDAIELFKDGTVVDLYGDINVDGNGETWEYLDGWAYRNNDAEPSATFDDTEWAYSGANALDGCSAETNASCSSVFPIGTFTTSQGCPCSELFISEYVEGSSNNKCIEIYNPTGSEVDLAAGSYQLLFYFNGGGSASTTIGLTGTVASGDVYVVCDNDADAALLAEADQESNSSFFNGDDAIELQKGGAVIDVIGQVGNDPGSQWGSGETSTADNTIRRKSTIQEGDTDSSDAFDPATEWDGFANNTFDGIGSHSTDCIVIACTISDITVSNISSCDNNGTDDDASDDTFTFDVTVTFSDAPSSGSLDISGTATTSVDATALDSPTSHTFTGLSATADGGAIEVMAAFSEVPACNASDNSETAPSACSFNPCGDLFFSEYIEGGNNNKCLEVYNPTGSDIDMAAEGYVINIYFNGSSNTGTTINLEGTIISGGTHVVCDDGVNTDLFNKTDQFSTDSFFSGDDAVELARGSVTLDVIGQIGSDPGSEWNENGVGTQNETLRRKASVLEGDKSGGDAFDPSLEWETYPQDNSDNLGVHVSDCISCDIDVKIEGNENFCAGESSILDAGVYKPLANVYEWSTGEMTQEIETNVPGVYTVTVTNDAGCQGTGEIQVNALASFEATADSEEVTQTATGLQVYQIEICGGLLPYELDLEATGGFATANQSFAGIGCRIVSVQFAPGVDWVLTVNDSNNCGSIVIDSQDLVTTPYGVISIETTETIQETCPNTEDGGLTIEIDGGDNSCGNYELDWSGPNYTSSSTEDASTLPFSVSLADLAAGLYHVTVTDCAGQTLTHSINVTRKSSRGRGRGRGRVNCDPAADKTSFDHPSVDFVELFPNPFSQTAQLQFGLSISANVNVDVYTMDGRKAAHIFNGTVEEGQSNILILDASQLAAGVYVLQLTTDSGVVHHEKLYIAK